MSRGDLIAAGFISATYILAGVLCFVTYAKGSSWGFASAGVAWTLLGLGKLVRAIQAA